MLFDNESEVLYDRVKPHDISPMAGNDYTVRGCTALIDAIGGAIHHIGNIHKYARPEDVPEHTLFVITTDGQENASHRYTSEQVKKMIERQKEKYGWEFLFIGANIDAVETAARYGISKDRAVNYNTDGQGTHILYESVAEAVCNVRACKPLQADWSEDINADYQRRGRNKPYKDKAPLRWLNLRRGVSHHTVSLGLIEFYNKLFSLKTSLMGLFVTVVYRTIPLEADIASSAEKTSNIKGFEEIL